MTKIKILRKVVTEVIDSTPELYYDPKLLTLCIGTNKITFKSIERLQLIGIPEKYINKSLLVRISVYLNSIGRTGSLEEKLAADKKARRVAKEARRKALKDKEAADKEARRVAKADKKAKKAQLEEFKYKHIPSRTVYKVVKQIDTPKYCDKLPLGKQFPTTNSICEDHGIGYSTLYKYIRRGYIKRELVTPEEYSKLKDEYVNKYNK